MSECSVWLSRVSPGLLRVLGLILLAASADTALAQANTPAHFDLPAQPLEISLQDIAKSQGLQIVYVRSDLQGLQAPALKGVYTAAEALLKLTSGTKLVTSFDGHNTFVLKPQGAQRAEEVQESVPASSLAQGFPGAYRVAQAGSGGADNNTRLEEVVVTAQKRVERLHDVPIPVTAVNTDMLLETNQTRIQDFYTMVPGLTISSDGYHSMSSLAIRGISPDGFGNPTVGITVDDVPLGAPTSFGYGQFAPDIDPNELAGIEVLRGPQGTLYGANSLGGLLKYVTVDPSTDSWDGRFETGISSIHNGAQLGYDERGSANVPLSDTLAVGLSAFTRLNPGYIDDPFLNERGVNWADDYGGRLAMLWKISPSMTLRVSALLQDSIQHGAPYVDVGAGLGDLQQNYLRGTGQFSQHIQLYTAKLTAKLVGIDVTSVSGYSINSFNDVIDDTPYFGGPAEVALFGVNGAAATEAEKNRMFTQELRFSSSIGEHFDWLLGGFYEDARTPDVQTIPAVDPATGYDVGQLLYINDPATYKEYAAFADLTFHFTDRINLQVGGRQSHNSQTYLEVLSGPDCGCGAVSVGPVEHSHDNAFTYLVTPQFKLSPDLMAYARVASGYRPGGPNTVLPGIPPQFKHDTTENYEIGIKGSALDRTLSFDASLYYIDWKDIELSLLSPTGYGYYANGDTAKSEGVELSIESRPVQGLKVSAWVAWNEATLTAPLPSGGSGSAVGLAGDRLPSSARLSGNLTLQQSLPLGSGITGFAGGSLSYVGDQVGVFTSSERRQRFPAYAKTDLRAGLQYEAWTFNLYANNVTDRRAVTSGGLGVGPYPNAFVYIQPRTIGANLIRKF